MFLDRDGVINSLVYHKDAGALDSPFTLGQFRLLPRVARAIRVLNDLRCAVVIVSNQPGAAKGHFDAGLLGKFDAKLRSALKPVRAHVDATYYCLHHPDAVVKALRKRCSCRKPGIGLLTRAEREMGLSLSQAYMVGDGLSDIEAGVRACCRTVFWLVLNPICKARALVLHIDLFLGVVQDLGCRPRWIACPSQAESVYPRSCPRR